MNRFADIDYEFKRLPPIYGYHSQPLVSIEKALETIQPNIDQLPRYIKIAKKHCHFPSEHGLTKDESAAIYIYTMEWGETTLYRILNQALRSENRQALKIWFPYLELFDTALEKLPTVKEVIWRGVALDVGKNYHEDQVLTWWSVNSCSSSVNVIKNFVGDAERSTLFLIEAIHGKKIRGYTEYENENEIILSMGTEFRVKCDPLKQSNGSFIVHLIEINDDNVDDQSVASTMKKTQDNKTNELNKQDSEQYISLNRININTKWKQNGITVAGGNGRGNQLNQLQWPSGIYIDDYHQCIFIADWGNNRILQWKFNTTNGQIVAGGNGSGNRDNQLQSPYNVIVDRKTDSLIICDYGNRRVMQCPRQNGQNGQTIISDIRCSRLTIDHNGNLYVSDSEKDEVRRYEIGDIDGTIVAGGNGQGNRLDQLSDPSFIFVDKDSSVYVSDWGNHRIIKWLNGAREGIVVAGGQGQGDRLTQLYRPKGLFVDHQETVYVCDCGNDRVMCWPKGAKEGRIVVGGNGTGSQSNQLDCPQDLSFDREGNLYVSEWANCRIQKFEVESW